MCTLAHGQRTPTDANLRGNLTGINGGTALNEITSLVPARMIDRRVIIEHRIAKPKIVVIGLPIQAQS